MGTHQQLTTEQVEVLILIDAVNEFYKNRHDELETAIEEIIDNNKITKDPAAEICGILEDYGYIEENEAEFEFDKTATGYVLTRDGKQYIRLFEEYLEAKKENPEVIHNHFSVINIKKLQFSLIDSFKLFEMDIEASEIMKFAKGILDSIKAIVKKREQK